jgi:hypothetical protein
MCFDLGLCVSTANGRRRERRSSVLGVRVELAQRAVGTHRNASGVVVGCGGRSHLEDDWRKAPKGRVGRLGERERERSVVGSGVDSSLRRNDVRRGRSQGRQGSRRAGPRSRGEAPRGLFPSPAAIASEVIGRRLGERCAGKPPHRPSSATSGGSAYVGRRQRPPLVAAAGTRPSRVDGAPLLHRDVGWQTTAADAPGLRS